MRTALGPVATMLIAAASPLAAQAPGIPYYQRFTTRGVALAVDYGFAGPKAPTTLDAWAVAATFAFGPRIDTTSARVFNAGASLSRFFPRGGARSTVWGVQAGVFYDILHVGFAHWDSAGATRWRAPIAFGIPLIGCDGHDARKGSIIMWGSIRLDVDHRSITGLGSRTIGRRAYAFGIQAELANGVGVQVAADQPRLLGKHVWIFGAGVHYAFYRKPPASPESPKQASCFVATGGPS